jgi:hypothetical protein
VHDLEKMTEPCRSWGGRGGGAGESARHQSSAEALRAAANLVETVAYEKAPGLTPDVIVGLILVAAQLERLANALEADYQSDASLRS